MDRYSRMIAWLKVLLPLMALALLSTLFLLSRNVDPMASIPFADAEIQARLRDQQITGPFFSGSTARGDQISFSASKMGTGQKNGATIAQDLSAQIDLASGARIVFFADTGSVDLVGDTSVLSGNVLITTSSGYKINSDRLISTMSSLHVESPEKVVAEGPLGALTAGSMQIGTPENAETAQLLFTNGVKLIYDPQTK
ncbi:MAG: lipopolysaccharide export system protein LptC [Candidatus Azotimanducaceae bacterium]|jgi:lipopolysaccharide export system protein LptC